MFDPSRPARVAEEDVEVMAPTDDTLSDPSPETPEAPETETDADGDGGE